MEKNDSDKQHDIGSFGNLYFFLYIWSCARYSVQKLLYYVGEEANIMWCIVDIAATRMLCLLQGFILEM